MNQCGWHGNPDSVVLWNNAYPRRSSHAVRKHLSWLNPDLLQAIKRRNTIYRAYKCTGSLNKLTEYRFLRNSIVSAIRLAKHAYLNDLHHVEPKTFWKRINPSIIKVFLLSPVRVSTSIPMLGKLSSKINNSMITSTILIHHCYPLISHASHRSL